MRETFTFADVLLEPKYSEIKSRSDVDISVKLSKGINLKLPFIPANMKNITGKEMIREAYKKGMLSLTHRFASIKEQIDLLLELRDEFGDEIFSLVGVSIGVKEEDYQNIQAFNKLGIKIICVDVAHGDSILSMNMIKYIANTYPKLFLIAGNFCTASGVARAFRLGADCCKVGIGSSGICSTRLETGNGVPQLSAVIDADHRRKELSKEIQKKLFIISDGGIRITSDCVKSLCFADLVMMGGIFAGTDEAPGAIRIIDGKQYKQYEGSSTHKTDRVEGVRGLVEPKGPVANVIRRLSEGLQSGCSYQNCRNLKELKEDPIFIRITNPGLLESGIRDVLLSESK